jgi:hypothetical protein
MRDIEKDRDRIKSRAKALMDAEDGYDWSMRDVFLDKFVTEAVTIRAKEYMGYIDQILDDQIDLEEISGIQTKVVKVDGEPFGWKYYKNDCTYELEALLIYRDQSLSWIVFREIVLPNYDPTKFSLNYHVREITLKGGLDMESIDEVSYKKYCKYGDLRDKGSVISLGRGFSDDELKVDGENSMLSYYRQWQKFSHIFARIRIMADEDSSDI